MDFTTHRKYSCQWRAKTKELIISKTSGAGAVGFKLYNADHKMIYAANTYNIALPDDIIGTEYYVVAALGDGTDIIIYDPRNLTAVKDATSTADDNAKFDESQPAYDLFGREVTDLKRGCVYIQKGKKVRY